MNETSTILKVAHREIRVMAAGLRPANRISSFVRVSDFAQAILDCYAGRRGLWPLLERVFRLSRPGTTLQVVHHHAHTHLAPRLELTVLDWSSRPAATPTADRSVPGLRLQPQTHLLSRTFSRLAEEVVEQLTERLVVRGVRIEVGTAVTRLNPSQGRPLAVKQERPAQISIPAVPPVRRVVHRPIVVDAKAEAVSGSAAGSPSASLGEFKKPTAATGAPNAPFDFNGLTDQVIRVIDQRIIAQRERLGRI